jgi:hypothetical protein
LMAVPMQPRWQGELVASHPDHSLHFTASSRREADASDMRAASCSCGAWRHPRLVDPENQLDRAEVANLWLQHANPGGYL